MRFNSLIVYSLFVCLKQTVLSTTACFLATKCCQNNFNFREEKVKKDIMA